MSPEQPVFYYDLGSLACYLAAERIMSDLPVAPEWEPVLGSVLGLTEPEPDRRMFERLASSRQLQPLHLPDRWPPDTRAAMLAAAYAKQIGRAVAFSLAAFRQAFAGGRDLADPDTVLIAAAACEMHPAAVTRALGLRSVTEALERSCARALRAGVRSLPAVQVGDRTFHGDSGLDAAARALGEQR